MACRSNPIYRALNRPLTILGAERKLFFVAVSKLLVVIPRGARLGRGDEESLSCFDFLQRDSSPRQGRGSE